eukprot:scaffold5088_cov17-Tisochrysis_lutea.AAC.2
MCLPRCSCAALLMRPAHVPVLLLVVTQSPRGAPACPAADVHAGPNAHMLPLSCAPPLMCLPRSTCSHRVPAALPPAPLLMR